MTKKILTTLLLFATLTAAAQSTKKSLADYVQPFIGVISEGACMPGPALPHASIYPSPNTLVGNNGGYAPAEKIVGFAQLHAQGTGGLKPYGNFLVSPQRGLQIEEAKHQSKKEEEVASAYYYKVKLKSYNILAEIAPTHNAALYRFTFGKSDSSSIVIDVARKLGGALGLDSGSVSLNKENNTMYGGGRYTNNWPDGRHKWNMYFYAEFSKAPDYFGTWTKDQKQNSIAQAAAKQQRLGGYVGFKTENGEVVYLKIAISFKSIDHAQKLLQTEIPAWDFERIKQVAKKKWNEALGKITIDGSEEEKIIFYTHLFHAHIQPRDRTGNSEWDNNDAYFDDHYTLWDSWKTVFPLMAIVQPEMVSATINSFINRHARNGYVAEAFINGKESAVGQGGNTVDNVVADAFVRKIPGIDWEKAYSLLKYNADKMRTSGYRELGYMYHQEPHGYSWRTKAGSATIAFSFNDFSIATVAKGLNKTADFNFYQQRASNWKNSWNEAATSDGFKGFIMARKKDGSFDEIDPKTGYNKHFYEGTCWEYSYELTHDVPELVRLMGGKAVFTKRLQHALDNDLIDFSNEPSFATPWLFAHEAVNEPNLTSYYVRKKIAPLFTRYDLPGDDDQGAMGSFYVFLQLGLFPFAATNKFYLHGPSIQRAAFKLGNGKEFVITAPQASTENIYIQSVKLNKKVLNRTYITHEEMMQGGVLEFVMTDKAVNFVKLQ
jgi:predicted alpha-1,2-mannosidase